MAGLTNDRIAASYDCLKSPAFLICVIGLHSVWGVRSEATPAPFGSNHYEFVQVVDPFTSVNNAWSTASAAAAASVYRGVNGHLVTITSQAENDFVYGLVSGSFSGFTGAWMGGKHPQGWLQGPETGQGYGYTNWAATEPNNAGYAYMQIGTSFGFIPPGSWADDSGVQGVPDPSSDPVIGYFVEYEGSVLDTLFYGGDPESFGPNHLNESNYTFPDHAIYVNFAVPSGEAWQVSRLFANTIYNSNGNAPQNSPQNTQALYEIRSGVSAGDGGTLLASGVAAAVPTPTGFSASGYNGFRIDAALSSELSLTSGEYWASLVPIDSGNDLLAGLYLTDETNSIGSAGKQSNYFTTDGFTFAEAPAKYSFGVRGLSATAGDYNRDGRVDAADYVVWRKTDGTPAKFEEWRANFGHASSSGNPSVATVPEATAWSLLSIFAIFLKSLRPTHLRVKRADVLHGCRQLASVRCRVKSLGRAKSVG